MSELLKKYYNIMDMYKNGEFGTEHLSLAEILEKAGDPDLINRMNQSEIQHLIDNSTGLKKHMFIELKSKIKETSGVNKEQKFDVLAVPCNRAFVVAKEKSEAFKNSKSNFEEIQEIEEMAKKIKPRINSENIISDANIFLTKEDHEQIVEDVIYSILRNNEFENNENVGKLAKKLTTNIENGSILRKTPSNSVDYYDEQVEELCLYRYKRYLGSLRCLLDTQNMRKAIQEEVKNKTKSLIKEKKLNSK